MYIGYLGVFAWVPRAGEHVMGLFGPKQNPKAIGERSQAVIIFKLLEAGYNVLTP